ncbi:hypothetical protein O6H91_17G007900 [Diphasiastrum complanatum]|uniref:Uncharacterized protein n=1 Tax=Diphasiastrum complanatum TaxID=34168 RepID=A0ACC2B453_DIPCM|nr:hypothetical protein O6H91_17G007900 [Diphasiastrum complanatum]
MDGATPFATFLSSSHATISPCSIFSFHPFSSHPNLLILRAPIHDAAQSTLCGSSRLQPLLTHHQNNKKQRVRQEELVCLATKQNTQTQTPETRARNLKRDYPQNWQNVGLWLFALGFILGPLLDGIHSRVQLQVYDRWAVDIGALHTNVWVFPLLGTFYAVVGLLQLSLDSVFGSSWQFEAPSFRKVLSSFIYLIFFLELSAELYRANIPYNIEAYILFALAQLNWALFESTWWGFALACVVGVGCPLSEIPIIKYFGLWHYSKPNFELFGEGLVTWVICCYFSYTPFLSNLSRWLSFYLKARQN